MATPEGAKEATTAWLRDQFRRYYDGTKPAPPDRFGRREFGFIYFGGKGVDRHRGFASAGDLEAHLARHAPAHVYYSSAYYERPDAPTMEEKGWLGADLVFDLDADHIPTAKHLSYADMLEAVRQRILTLHDDFLVGDFGFDEGRMRIVFSGGRGYHIHVFDERVWTLGSHERREIVDWITAKGFDVAGAFKESAFDSREFRGRTRVKTRIVGPSTAEPGWRGKIARGVDRLTRRLEGMGHDDAIAFLTSFEGVKAAEAEELYESLFKVRTAKPRPIRGVDRLREGQLEALPDRARDLLIRIVVGIQQIRLDERAGVPLEGIVQRGETDEPVTSDIKRLIRMPSSLHGKTGLAVVPLTRDALDDFRPLRDAVPAAWTDEPTPVIITAKINAEIRGEAFNLTPGVNKVPQFLAIFLAARGLAAVA